MLLDGVDRDDARVVESGDGARFAFEAGAAIGIVGGIVRQHLERDLASELRVLGKVHLAHAAGAECAEDPIVRDGLPEHEAVRVYPALHHIREAQL